MMPRAYEARLKKIDPRLRIRKRGSVIMYDGSVDSVVAVYKGQKYTGFRFDLGELTLNTKHFTYDHTYNPVAKNWSKKLKTRKRRGRQELTWLLTAHGFIRSRWAKQLMRI